MDLTRGALLAVAVTAFLQLVNGSWWYVYDYFNFYYLVIRLIPIGARRIFYLSRTDRRSIIIIV